MAENLPEGTDSIIDDGPGATGKPAFTPDTALSDATGGAAEFKPDPALTAEVDDQAGGNVGQGATSGQASFGQAGTSGAGGTSGQQGGAGQNGASDSPSPGFQERIQALRGQATDRARDYATQGRDRLTSALDDVVKMVDDVAGQIDAKIGNQYGDHVRRASSSVAGFADTLRNQDVDDLFQQAQDLVRKSPAVAIGTAAALGFAIARVVKAGGLGLGETDASSSDTKG